MGSVGREHLQGRTKKATETERERATPATPSMETGTPQGQAGQARSDVSSKRGSGLQTLGEQADPGPPSGTKILQVPKGHPRGWGQRSEAFDDVSNIPAGASGASLPFGTRGHSR